MYEQLPEVDSSGQVVLWSSIIRVVLRLVTSDTFATSDTSLPLLPLFLLSPFSCVDQIHRENYLEKTYDPAIPRS